MKIDRSILRLALIAAATFTALVYGADSLRQGSSDHDWASRLAHQVLSQAEAFLLAERSEGRAASLDPVVRNLTQGLDPRVIHVSKIRGPYTALPSVVSETRSEGLYELSKILSTDGMGVKIQVQIPPTGFLGTRSLFFRDLSVLFFFAFMTAFAYLAKAEWDRRHGIAPAPTALTSDGAAEPQFAVYGGVASVTSGVDERTVARQRELLKQVGIRFKSTFDLARSIAVASAKTHQHVTVLRDGVHIEIDRLRESQALSAESQQFIDHLEVISLNLVIEGKSQLAEQLHPLIRQLRQSVRASQLTLRDLELQLEPWATDADLAFHTFTEVENAAKGMDDQLPAVKAAMIELAKLLQRTNDEAGSRQVA